MDAREMFESLGYGCNENTLLIQYINDDDSDYKCIEFDLEYHTFYAQYNYEAKCITVDEFKAIQQQMKELGWLNENAKKEKENEQEFM